LEQLSRKSVNYLLPIIPSKTSPHPQQEREFTTISRNLGLLPVTARFQVNPTEWDAISRLV